MSTVGTGPVDAVYMAIQQIVNIPVTLLEYSVQSVTRGIDALGEVNVRVSADEEPELDESRINPQSGGSRARVYHGHGAHTDVIVASAKAYLASLNRLLSVQQNRSAREAEVATSA